MPKGKAYKEAFDEPDLDDERAYNRAYKLEKKGNIHAYIESLKEAVKVKILEEAEPSFIRLVGLAESAKNEMVRFQANKLLLNLGGFSESVKFSQVNILNLITPEQLSSLIRESILRGIQRQKDPDAIDVEFEEVGKSE